ncbi:hypothetical protein L211DRAFT_639069 [Terfezia boudieri ATCC MYA-4762]|uniref:Uncharacterized protein n=1 Tax=Terfezia boudieri ATCC MYA-4762 TaxID=1051890 RepID=A0A3N4LMY5_9PEZI|nr:hypothetical protein L211DRAFT_639069 [Terfezia boudieri ATCC MYA-4762]
MRKKKEKKRKKVRGRNRMTQKKRKDRVQSTRGNYETRMECEGKKTNKKRYSRRQEEIFIQKTKEHLPRDEKKHRRKRVRDREVPNTTK